MACLSWCRVRACVLCAAVHPTSELKLNPGSDTTWNFVCEDFSEGELKKESLALRFKTQENSEEFKRFYNEARTGNAALGVGSGSGAASSAAAAASAAAPAAVAATTGASGAEATKDRLLEKIQGAGNPWFDILSDAANTVRGAGVHWRGSAVWFSCSSAGFVCGVLILFVVCHCRSSFWSARAGPDGCGDFHAVGQVRQGQERFPRQG